MNDLLNKSSAQIAAEYRRLFAAQLKVDPRDRWTYGAQLKKLRVAFAVVRESEQVRTR